MKSDSQLVAIMAVFRTLRNFDTSLTKLEDYRETNNPIAYSLKQLKSHDLIRLDGFEADLRFQVALMVVFDCCMAVASSNSLILDFVFVENSLSSQNHGL